MKASLLAVILITTTASAQQPLDYAVLSKRQIAEMKLPVMGSCKPGDDLDRMYGNSPRLHRTAVPVPAPQREHYAQAYGLSPSEYRGRSMDIGCSCHYKSNDPFVGGPAAECAIGLFVDGADMFPRRLQHERDLAAKEKNKQADSQKLTVKLTRCVQNGVLTNKVKGVGEDDSHCRSPTQAERTTLGMTPWD